MKLFVWKGVLCDYSCGMIICVAENLETAQKAYIEEWELEMKMEIPRSYAREIYETEPIVYDLNIPHNPICHYVTGGS